MHVWQADLGVASAMHYVEIGTFIYCPTEYLVLTRVNSARRRKSGVRTTESGHELALLLCIVVTEGS